MDIYHLVLILDQIMAMISQTDQMEVIGLVRVQIIIKFLNGGMVIGLGHTVKGEISIGV